MLTVDEAYEKLSVAYPRYAEKVSEARETDDLYLFITAKPGYRPLPGDPVRTVAKKDGSISGFCIPPMENLKLLREAKPVPFQPR